MFHTMDRRWFLKTAGGITAAAAVGGARCPLRAADGPNRHPLPRSLVGSWVIARTASPVHVL